MDQRNHAALRPWRVPHVADGLRGFAAVWSALAERHRLVRVAAFCGLPAALVVASAPGLAIWVLAEMLPITLVLVLVPFVVRAPYGRAWAGLPKPRFGFRDLFFATFLVALALSAILLLGKQSYVPRLSPILFPWSRWVLEPTSLLFPVLGAMALVMSRRALWWRIVLLIAGCGAGAAAWYVSAYFLYGLTAWTFEWSWFDHRWMAWAPPTLTALWTAALLWFWHRRRQALPACNADGRRPLWPLAAAIARGVALAFLLLPAGYMYWALIRPVSIPEGAASAPNEFSRLADIGWQLRHPSLPPAERAALLAEARRNLASPVAIVLNYKEEPGRTGSALRGLYDELRNDARALYSSGRAAAAADRYLEMLAFSGDIQKGGNHYIALVAAVYVLTPAYELGTLAPDLTSTQCRKLLDNVRGLDVPSEPVEETMRRNYVYECATDGWRGRWRQAVLAVAGSDDAATQLAMAQQGATAQLRILICELAIAAFSRQHGRPPESLDELVPEFLEAVPIDPFDGAPLKYEKEPTQYTVCSAGHGLPMFPLALRVVRPIP